MAISLASATQKTGTGSTNSSDYLLKATPENLKRVLHQYTGEANKYTFEDAPHAYSPMEYAIKLGEVDSVAILFRIGAKPDSSKNIIQFYIDHLTEEARPNVALLDLLFDQFPEAPVLEVGHFCSLVTKAVHHMRNYREIHWDVIDVLLKREKRVEGMKGVTPRDTLLNADTLRLKVKRTPQDEEKFLICVDRYLSLERKYYPHSDSGLTLEQFKDHTPIFLKTIADQCAALRDSSGTFHFFDELSGKALSSKEATVMEQARGIHEELNKSRINLSKSLLAVLRSFEDYFQKLVKKGSFITCFEPIVLDSLIETLREIDSPQAKETLEQLQKMGLKED